MTESDDEMLSAVCIGADEPSLASDSVSQKSQSQHGRFAIAPEKRLDELASVRLEPSTTKQTKWGIRVFKEWFVESSLPTEFEHESPEQLNTLLRSFYAEARTKTGEGYSKSALTGIRAAINRHLTSPPFNRTLNVMQDKEFMTSNHVLLGLIKEQKRAGKDTTIHHEPISEGDLRALYSSRTLCNDNPLSLVRKVWFELSLHLGRRGREGLRNLTVDSFSFKTDDAGLEYVEMAYNESDKNHKGLNSRERDKHPRMYSSKYGNCPVESLKMYIQKRNPNCEAFFQRPLSLSASADITTKSVWYANRAMGEKTLGNLMAAISADAVLSRRYTNHCVRATTATVLSNAGVSVMDVMSVTGHRDEASVRSYVTQPSVSKRREISGILLSSTVSSGAAVHTPPTEIPAAQAYPSPASLALSTVDQTNTTIQTSMPRNFGGLFQNAHIQNSPITVNFKQKLVILLDGLNSYSDCICVNVCINYYHDILMPTTGIFSFFISSL